MGVVQASVLLWTSILALAGAVMSAGPVGTAGIASGLHRRLDGAGFLNPQEDDFFADYKDLVTPPKDLLETPKDLLDTPKDLVETPEDLVESPKGLTDTPKDLLDDHDDLEAFGEHGGDAAEQNEEVDSTHPRDDDTAAHDELADLSLAKHLKNSDKEYGHQEDEPSNEHLEAPAPGSPFGPADAPASPFGPADASAPYVHEHVHEPVRSVYAPPAAPVRPTFGGGARGSPYQLDAGVRTAYPLPAAFKKKNKPANLHALPVVKSVSYNGHPSLPLRSSEYGEPEHTSGRIVRPEYAYRYGVHDPTTRDVKSAWEQRDGEDTRGGYALVEPNGRTRVVEYSVTKGGGFNARVKHLPPGHRGR